MRLGSGLRKQPGKTRGFGSNAFHEFQATGYSTLIFAMSGASKTSQGRTTVPVLGVKSRRSNSGVSCPRSRRPRAARSARRRKERPALSTATAEPVLASPARGM